MEQGSAPRTPTHNHWSETTTYSAGGGGAGGYVGGPCRLSDGLLFFGRRCAIFLAPLNSAARGVWKKGGRVTVGGAMPDGGGLRSCGVVVVGGRRRQRRPRRAVGKPHSRRNESKQRCCSISCPWPPWARRRLRPCFMLPQPFDDSVLHVCRWLTWVRATCGDVPGANHGRGEVDSKHGGGMRQVCWSAALPNDV